MPLLIDRFKLMGIINHFAIEAHVNFKHAH